MKMETSLELYNWKKNLKSLTLCCHDLDMPDGIRVLNGKAILNAVYLVQLDVSQNLGTCIKEGHPLWKHAICEIVYTRKIHSLAS